MTFIHIQNNKSYYCESNLKRTKITLDQHAKNDSLIVGGTFTIDNGRLYIKFIRFDADFQIPYNSIIESRSEENWIISSIEVYIDGLQSITRHGKAVYIRGIVINTALIGFDAWNSSDLVQTTQFRTPELDLILRYQPLFDKLSNSTFEVNCDERALSAQIACGSLSIYYEPSFSYESDYPNNISTVVDMEFSQGLSVREMRHQVGTFLRFLSATACRPIRPNEQTVSRFTHAEWISALNAGANPYNHSVYYQEINKESNNSRNRMNRHGAFATMYDEKERAAFEACLQAWFARDGDWQGATAAMMEAFAFRGVISADRLLNATKWIEATPGVKPQLAMNEEHILALCKLLGRNAKNLGYGAIAGRLRSSLRLIAHEPNVQRFARLATSLKAVYGTQIVGEYMAEWIAEAFSLRGKAAHNPLIGQTDTEFKRLAMATYAAEFFAYLMLLRDLPISDTGRICVSSCELAERYLLSVRDTRPRDIQ